MTSFIRFFVLATVLSCVCLFSSTATANSKPIFSLKNVVAEATWIAKARIVAVAPSLVCAGYSEYGKPWTISLEITETWKGEVPHLVELTYFESEGIGRFNQGNAIVVAFIAHAVPCGRVVYPQGLISVSADTINGHHMTGNVPESVSALKAFVLGN